MKRPSTLDILYNLGLTGSPLASNSLVPRTSSPASIQAQQEEFIESGKVADPDVWSKYSQILKRPSTLEGQYQLWDEMAHWDLMQAALVEIVDECGQQDQFKSKSLWYECNDPNVEEDLNTMLEQVNAEKLLPSQIWYIAAMGNHFEKIDYAPGEGVRGLSFVHPFEIRRYWLERNRQCIGFKWHGHEPNKDDVFVMPDNVTPIERVGLASGQNTIEELYYPWDFIHFRRLFRLRDTEHGEPLFEEAQGIYKKLRIALDQMVVHRAQVQPDRYLINIDVQDLPPTEQFKTVQRWRQSFRNKLSFGQGAMQSDLSEPDSFKSFYNPLALDTIIYMARPRGFAHGIEKLQGTQNVPDVYDIELLIDLFYSIIGMPKSWFGIGGDQGSQAPSGKSLLAQDIRFLRKVKSLRRPIKDAYTWLGYFHCLLKDKPIESLTVRTKMSDISGLEDQIQAEVIKSQAEVLQMMGDVMQQYNLPREAWIELIFKKYLHLPDDAVNIFITALPDEEDHMQQESEGMPAPSEKVLLEVISKRLMNPMNISKAWACREACRDYALQRQTLMEDKINIAIKNSIIVPVDFKNGDIIRVSTHKHDPVTEVTGLATKGKSVKPTMKILNEGTPEPTTGKPAQGWRRYVPRKA